MVSFTPAGYCVFHNGKDALQMRSVGNESVKFESSHESLILNLESSRFFQTTRVKSSLFYDGSSQIESFFTTARVSLTLHCQSLISCDFFNNCNRFV